MDNPLAYVTVQERTNVKGDRAYFCEPESATEAMSQNTAVGVAENQAGSGMTPDTEHLEAVFSVDRRKSRFVVLFPAFQMGLKKDGYRRAKTEGWFSLPGGTYHYRGLTSAMTAFGAVKGLIAILGRLFEPDELQSRLVFATDEETESLMRAGGYTHYILLGTRSHQYAREVLTQYSEDFEFQFGTDNWSVLDKREDQTYSVPDPSQVAPEVPGPGMDYALIEKIIDPVSQRVIFVIGGMWDTGTLAAGNFLIEHREEIFKQFGAGGFQYLLEIVPGSTRVRRIVLARSPRES